MSDQSLQALPADEKYPKDRKVGLVFFGLVQIALGGVFGLMALFQALMTRLPTPGLDQTGTEGATGSVLFVVAFFAPLAVMFVWLGVGSIMARRWSRALSLVVGWLWLAGGVVSFLGVVLFLPSFSEVMREASTAPAVSEEQVAMMMAVMRTVMIVFQAIFFIILPGSLVLFYRSKHVKATCEARDPKVRWTDNRPLPVLALSGFLGFGAYQSVVSGLSSFRMFPAFGTLLRGAPAVVLLCGVGVVLVFLSRGVYRLDVRAWWAVVGFYILALISSTITFMRISPSEMLEAMQFPEGQLENFPSALLGGSTMLLFMCIGGATWLGFLWYVKRYFNEGEVAATGAGSG